MQTKERGLRRNQLCQHLDVGLLTSRNVRKTPVASNRWYFGMVALATNTWCNQGGGSYTCYDLNCVPPQSLYVKVLTPIVTEFGDRTFENIIKVKLGHRMEP